MDAEKVVALGRLALAFGRVERATFHEDGRRPETDADHTVMLGLIACAFCPDELDRGEVAQLVLVHDLVEAYADDTNTAFITEAGRAAKAEREAAAMVRLRDEFRTTPWLLETLERYEDQADPEARFVRYLDKAMPKVTHLLNGCAAIKAMGRARDDIENAHAKQRARLAGEYPDAHPWVVELMDDLMAWAAEAF